jgi:hypothetical protein
MGLSKTDIANQALGRIGAQRIMDLDDQDSKSARICKNAFEATVREVGRSAEWNCLKDRDTLGRLTTAPKFGWAYQYQLPANFLRMLKLNGTAADNDPGDEFEVEGRKLLTDAEEANITFITYKEDTNEYDALFTNAVVVLLASKIAVPLRQDGAEMSQALLSEYQRVALPQARTKDGAERKRRRYDPASESSFLAARHFSTNG